MLWRLVAPLVASLVARRALRGAVALLCELLVVVVPLLLALTVFSEWTPPPPPPPAAPRDSFWSRGADVARWQREKLVAPDDVVSSGLVWPLLGTLLWLAFVACT